MREIKENDANRSDDYSTISSINGRESRKFGCSYEKANKTRDKEKDDKIHRLQEEVWSLKDQLGDAKKYIEQMNDSLARLN